MGIHTQTSNIANTSIRYSAFLGMLYVSTPETEAHVREAKALIGEAEVKKGFQGNKSGPSAEALKFLKEKGVTPVKISGILSSAFVKERPTDNGRTHLYLTVGLKDDDGRYYVSVNLAHPGAQMLVRKLANAEIGINTEINMFATHGQRPGATRSFANHGASVKQNGQEIAGTDPKEVLLPRITAAVEALKAAGVSEDDKETFAKRRDKVTLEYHVELMKSVTDKVSKFYEDREISDDDAEMPEVAEDDAEMPEVAF